MASSYVCSKVKTNYPGHGAFWQLPQFFAWVPEYANANIQADSFTVDAFGEETFTDAKNPGSYWKVTGDGGVFYFDAHKKTFKQLKPDSKTSKVWGPCQWPKGMNPAFNFGCCPGPQAAGVVCTGTKVTCPGEEALLGRGFPMWAPILVVIVFIFVGTFLGLGNLVMRK